VAHAPRSERELAAARHRRPWRGVLNKGGVSSGMRPLVARDGRRHKARRTARIRSPPTLAPPFLWLIHALIRVDELIHLAHPRVPLAGDAVPFAPARTPLVEEPCLSIKQECPSLGNPCLSLIYACFTLMNPFIVEIHRSFRARMRASRGGCGASPSDFAPLRRGTRFLREDALSFSQSGAPSKDSLSRSWRGTPSSSRALPKLARPLLVLAALIRHSHSRSLLPIRPFSPIPAVSRFLHPSSASPRARGPR
jgi:hypothetical protein